LRHFHARNWRGFFPLLRTLRSDGLVRARLRYGAVFSLSPLEYIDSLALREGFYESEVFSALQPFFAPGRVFWDIGANIGLHAVSAATVCPGLVVCAFEPNPQTLVRLRANIALNAASVTVWPGALGAIDGDAHLSLTTHNNGMSTIVDRPAATGSAAVSLARAETLVAQGRLPAPDIVKLDVEGYEAHVLDGFGALLQRPALRAVVFESAAESAADFARCPTASRLLAAGFTIAPLSRRETTAHLLGNFIATRA
jgi:FkbM family methyltransferase